MSDSSIPRDTIVQDILQLRVVGLISENFELRKKIDDLEKKIDNSPSFLRSHLSGHKGEGYRIALQYFSKP